MARGHYAKLFSFTTGAVRLGDLAYLLLTNDEASAAGLAHVGVVEWDAGTWRDGGQQPWASATCTIVKQPREQLLVVGIHGEVFAMGSGETHTEKIGTPASSPRRRGPLRCVRWIGEHAYAVGMDRQVYRREASKRWVVADAGARPRPGARRVVGFEAIDGVDETDLYAVGWDGEIWRSDGDRWTQLESPTDAVLANVCCVGDRVYACGRRGLLLEGRGDSWAKLRPGVAEDLWGLCAYAGHLYVASMHDVYRLERGKLVPVRWGRDRPRTCYHLSAADGVLWSIGSKDVMAYDGTRWTRVD